MFINNAVASNNSCYLSRCCVSCIMYADDLMLSPSVTGLQKLLDISVSTANELCLQFNDKKSHCMVIGPKYNSKPVPMFLLGNSMEWVDSVK